MTGGPTDDDDRGVGRDVVSIDFDATLHAYAKGWGDGSIYDVPTPGAVDAVNELVSRGYQLVISTCRQDLPGIAAWLDANGFPAGIKITNAKPIATCYIDDRGVTFRGDWPAVLAEITERFE